MIDDTMNIILTNVLDPLAIALPGDVGDAGIIEWLCAEDGPVLECLDYCDSPEHKALAYTAIGFLNGYAQATGQTWREVLEPLPICPKCDIQASDHAQLRCPCCATRL